MNPKVVNFRLLSADHFSVAIGTEHLTPQVGRETVRRAEHFGQGWTAWASLDSLGVAGQPGRRWTAWASGAE
jgi:hypothetical protein